MGHGSRVWSSIAVPFESSNDTVGFVVHSSLLVPYFSWKISHGKHHKATGHIERDIVFMPRTRSEFAKRVSIAIENLSEVVEDAPLYSFFIIFARQLLEWPFFLLANRTGHNYHERQPEGRGKNKMNGWGGGVNHFSPSSPLQRRQLDYCQRHWYSCDARSSIFDWEHFGWSNLAVWYFLPCGSIIG